MTISPVELPDPGAAFFAGDPTRFLEDNLPGQAPDELDEESHAIRNTAIGIAGAFMAWRFYAAHELRKAAPPTDAPGLLALFWARRAPVWLRIATPVATEIYRAIPSTMGQEELEAVAADYAAGLGRYIHETSGDAIVQGYHAALAAGTSPTLAWTRAVAGYGLDPRRLRGWLASVAADKTVPEDLISPGGKRALDRALLFRAEILGQNEAWHARHVAKTIVWMDAARSGALPPGTNKRWITAEDERVCVICGPLDRQLVSVTEQFTLPDGRDVWAPGVHPNCRCELKLVLPEHVPNLGETLVEKAQGDDPYDRDAQGQFSRRETRGARPVREREIDPEVARLFEQVEPAPTTTNPFGDAGPSTTNPFGTTSSGSSFGSTTSPFGSPSVGTNPFAAGNPFSAGDPFSQGSPFPEPVDLYIQLLETPRVPIDITPPPSMGGGSGGLADDPGRVAAVVGEEFFRAFNKHHSGAKGNHPFLDAADTGQMIDFDVAGVLDTEGSNEPSPAHVNGIALDRNITPMGDATERHHVEWDPAIKLLSDVVDNLAPRYGDHDELMSTDGSTMSYHAKQIAEAKERNQLHTDIENYTEMFIDPMDEEDIQNVLQAAGLYFGGEDSPEAQRALVMEQAQDPNSLVHEYIYEQNEDQLDSNEHRSWMGGALDSSQTQEIVPQLFVFPEGFYGGWEDEHGNPSNVPRIRGKYQVTRVTRHTAADEIEDSDGVSPHLKEWEEVALKPVSESTFVAGMAQEDEELQRHLRSTSERRRERDESERGVTDDGA